MQHRPVLMATLLAAVAGWVDALGFYALAGVFTAHLTGNLVLMGDELVHGGRALWPKLLVFPAFFLGVVLAALLHARRKAQKRSSVRAVLLAEAFFVLAFMAAGLVAGPVPEGADMGAVAYTAVLLGAVAMGIQNAEGRLALRELGSTAVMTTNITVLLLNVVNAWRAPAKDQPAAWQRARRQALPILTFSVGALAAAVVYAVFSYWGLLPPIVALCVLAALAD